MPDTIKVSLDEWATLQRGNGAELMTDGLAGCVAVAVRTDDRVALTHVYSDALDRFDVYRDQIRDFVAGVGGRDAIRELHLVHNGNPVRPGQEHNLAGMIQQHLVDQNVVHADRVRTHVDSGCAIGDDGFYLKQRDNPAMYRGYTNTELEQLPAPRQQALNPALVHNVFANSQGNPQPCDVEQAPRDAAAAHLPQARYVDPPPPQAQVPVEAPVQAPPSVRDAMAGQIAPTLRDNGFQMNSSPLARDLARLADENGLTEITRVAVNRAPDALPRITLEGHGRQLEFDANGRNAVLRPAPEAIALPVAPVANVAPIVPQGPVPALQPGAQAPSLYQQSIVALGPQMDALGLRDEQQRSLVAREVASQAQHDGLARVDRIAVNGQPPSVTAHQDGPDARQSQALSADALLGRAGVVLAQGLAQGPGIAPQHEGHEAPQRRLH
jgi:hypothetical protein